LKLPSETSDVAVDIENENKGSRMTHKKYIPGSPEVGSDKAQSENNINETAEAKGPPLVEGEKKSVNGMDDDPPKQKCGGEKSDAMKSHKSPANQRDQSESNMTMKDHKHAEKEISENTGPVKRIGGGDVSDATKSHQLSTDEEVQSGSPKVAKDDTEGNKKVDKTNEALLAESEKKSTGEKDTGRTNIEGEAMQKKIPEDPVDAKETTPLKDGDNAYESTPIKDRDSDAIGPEFVDAMNSEKHLSITEV